MTHKALARRYRPTRFADLVGQEHVAAGLTGAVAKGRVAHGYLLTGPRGVGKTTAARILAMALNCERKGEAAEGEPCGSCDACQRIWSGLANLDVVEIDAASNRGVDDARELRERAMYAASGPDRHKIYIVDEAHMLTREAWNALLKILEEPPPRVHFVFATTEPHKIANTATAVLSRLQRFDFRSIGPGAIEARLRAVAEAEGLRVEDDAYVLIGRVANGGMRDALSVLDQVLVFGDDAVTAARVRDVLGLIGDEAYAELLDIVAQRRAADVFPFVARLVEQGADLGEFVNGMAEMLRAVMLTLLGGTPQGLTEGMRDAVERAVPSYREGDLLRMLHLLAESETALRRSPNVRLHVETLLLQWTLLDRTVELGALLEALGGPPGNPGTGGERPSGPGVPPASSAPAGGGGSPGAPAASTRGPATSVTSIDGIRGAWAGILARLGADSPLLREALLSSRPVGFEGDTLTVEVPADALDWVRRNVRDVETATSEVIGRPVRVAVGAERADAGAPSTRKRHTTDDHRTDRMRGYREQDPSLDAMADALDLELTE